MTGLVPARRQASAARRRAGKATKWANRRAHERKLNMARPLQAGGRVLIRALRGPGWVRETAGRDWAWRNRAVAGYSAPTTEGHRRQGATSTGCGRDSARSFR